MAVGGAVSILHALEQQEGVQTIVRSMEGVGGASSQAAGSLPKGVPPGAWATGGVRGAGTPGAATG